MLKPAVMTPESNSLTKANKGPEKPIAKTSGKDKAVSKDKAKKNENTGVFSKLFLEKQAACRGDGKVQSVSLKDLLAKIGQFLDGKNSGVTVEDLISQIKKLIKKIINQEEESDQTALIKLQDLFDKIRQQGKLVDKDLLALLSEWDEIQADGIDTEIRENVQPDNQTDKLKNTLPAKKKFTQDNDTGEPRIVVIDLRKPEEKDPGKNRSRTDKINLHKDQGDNLVIREQDPGNDNREIKFYSAAGSRQDNQAGDNQNFNPSFNKAHQALSTGDLQKFKDTLKGEIVKNTSLILKTNDTGEIRLILKPEALGRVRINLNLNNNHIDGRILVENNSVREIFETSLASLNEALKDEGFDSVALQVSVGNHNREQKREQESVLGGKEAAGEFERNIPLFAEYNLEHALVNLMV